MSATATPVLTADLNVTTLAAGDRVGVTPSNVWGHYRVATVARVTPGGQVTLDDGLRFTRDGYEINGGPRRRKLVAAAWVEKVETDKKVQAARDQNAVKLENDLKDILRGARNGYGNLVGEITAEQKAALVAMIQAL